MRTQSATAGAGTKRPFGTDVFSFWFRRLVYNQIWEDPEADLAALRLPLGSTIVTISSGGCNALRDGAGLISPVQANLRQFMEGLPAREIDAVVLLDSQDWMASDEIHALWNAIDRVGSDNVRVIFRAAGKESPLENDELAPLQKIWHRDEERSAVGFRQDRSGIYGGFHCDARVC